MKLNLLKVNPNNPQKFDDLSKLKKSIIEFPKMMELRPMVYDPVTMWVLGGNKRLICLRELGYKEIKDSWAISAEGLDEEEKKRFIIADNVGFGEWDLEILNENFDIDLLEDWGIDYSDISDIDFEDIKKTKQEKKETIPYQKTHILISFKPELILKLKPYLDEILKFEDIEYEQTSN